MWFKQIQVFHLTVPFNSAADTLAEKLELFAFKACLPSFQSALGWVPPIDEEGAPLARGINGCIMFCLQMEEKILPASVVNRYLKDKIKNIEMHEERKLRTKEKFSLKDEIIQTLLPRAFSKYTLIHAYLDTHNGWLIINTGSASRTEQFLAFFKKTFGEVIKKFDLIKTSTILTHWLKHQDHPSNFSVEKTCLLQDPNQQQRVIRCQQQDLFANSIISLIKDGCEVMQIALCWQDRISFVMNENFILRNVHMTDQDTIELNDEIETKHQKFDADFVMMTMMFRDLFRDLMKVFVKTSPSSNLDTKYALVG